MQSVNIDNWNFCRYEKGDFMAFISFGSDQELMNEERLEYYVTVLEKEQKEIFQETFGSVTEACLYLNKNYGDWAFNDQTAPKSGCSTCAAH